MSEHAALVIRGLQFRYPGAPDFSDRPTVDVQSLELAPGEQMLLQGGSGTGKSTLLQVIAGLLDPTAGEVWVRGTRLHDLGGGARDLFRGEAIGMVFQTFNLLYGFSAVENVMAAMMFSRIPRKEHRPRAESLLRQLGVEAIDRDPARLSVGQQQRVATARAVACDPVLVLADEPTASLDPANAANALDLIQSACREKKAALLCVSHDPALPALFERTESLEALRRPPAAR